MCFSVDVTLGSGSIMKTSPPLSSTARAASLLSAALLFFASSGCASLHSQAQRAPGAPADGAYDPALFAGLEYRMIGPHRGGRVTAVAGHTAHPHTFYMGPTGGGVWRTTDAGQTWEPIADGALPVGSIGAIDVADSNPDVIYVGTGSAAIRSNVSIGKGVWKSTDRGETWNFAGLPEAGQIGELIVHPSDPNTVWLAAVGNPFAPNPERGVFRTRDGGTSWEKVLFVSDSTGASDIAINPRNPDEIYAGMWRAERKPWTIISGAMDGGVYKSTDGGDSWTELTNGLPTGLTGKISVSVSPANPNRVYALIEAVEPEEGLYRSDDAGASWQLINGDEEDLLRRPFYYTYVDAHPTDPEVVWVNNEGFYKSVDGGRTFERKPTPHGDNHGMWINPENPDIIVQSNDGGANVSLNGGETWSTQLNQPTAELYQANVDDRFPYWVYAGQQDNTTIAVPSLPPTASAPDASLTWWRQIGGCETGPAVPKPGTEGQIVYSNCKGRFGRYNALTGQEKQFYVGAEYMYGHNPAELEYRFQRVSPIYVSPHDPNTVYHASQFLHRTTDGGVTWETISPDLTWNPPHAQVISGAPITRDVTGEEVYSTLYGIGESPIERGVLWAGANDGLIHVSRDNGATWTNITPAELPEGGRVQTVEPSPHRAGSAYIAVLRYMLDDWEPYIFRTDDYGQSWTRLTTTQNGMGADNPTRVVREDPEHEGLLYAGTEYGMWISWDNGARWQPFQLNLPHTPITDIKVNEGDLVLSTQGRSFWVLDDVDPLRQLSPEVARARAHLFTPPEGYRMRLGDFRYSDVAPEYPEEGVWIDYYLGEEPAGELTMEILDPSGTVVRRFSSEAPGEQMVIPEEPGMRGFQLEAVGTPKLPKERGMHRFRWDLTLPGPWDADASRSGRRGPMIVPGTYQARLSSGDWSETRPLVVQLDPRLVADGVTQQDLEQQLALNLQIRDAISEARLAAAQIDEAQEQLTNGAGETGGNGAASPILEQLAALESEFETAGGSYPKPQLIDQLGYLYGMTTSADQQLGRDAFLRYEVLREELSAKLAELARVLAEVPGMAETAGRR